MFIVSISSLDSKNICTYTHTVHTHACSRILRPLTNLGKVEMGVWKSHAGQQILQILFHSSFVLVIVINFKCTHLRQAALREGVQFVSWHNLTAVHQQTPVKLEVVSHRHQDPRCTTGKVQQAGFWRSEQRVGLRSKTPRWSDRGGGSRSVCSGLCGPFAVGMA